MSSKKKVPTALKRFVASRAFGLCEYCRSQEAFSPQPFSVEHILPEALGGLTEESNLAYSCQGCNGHKAVKINSIDPTTGVFAPLFHPRQHRRHEHFDWNDDFLELLGLTAIGRATISALQLNRVGVVNLRMALVSMGKHPPGELG